MKRGHTAGGVLPGIFHSVPAFPAEAKHKNGADESLRRQIVNVLTAESTAVVTTAWSTVADLRANLKSVSPYIDPDLLDVLLRELQEVLERDCRHAAIAIRGKLLELGLGSLLVAWQVQFPPDATLAVLIDRVRGRADPRQPDHESRTRAQELLNLGVPGMIDLIRTVRNGAVHARRAIKGGRVELTSSEQAEAVALPTADILKRFVVAETE
jgi:hypothetical protein